MRSLYTISQIHTIEKNAIKSGLSEYELMERAGAAAFKTLQYHYSHALSLDIICGKDNNGAVGYVVARLAAEQGRQVNIYSLASISELSLTAQQAAQSCMIESEIKTRINFQPYIEGLIFQSDIIIDAILSIEQKTLPNKLVEKAIHSINHSKRPVCALDVPSGLDADQGGIFGEAVSADLTITFIGIKQGLLTGLAPNYCGKIVCDNLDLPLSYYHTTSIESVILTEHALPQRKPADHKGLYGHVLIIGGDSGMGGAVCLAAEAALRTGAGLVTAITRPEHVPAILARCPEIMCQGFLESENLDNVLLPLLRKATVCVVGPGMVNSRWSNTLLDWILTQTSLPVILDAGAFGWLVRHNFTVPQNWVLTPHPGEAAHLLNISSKEIQQARFASIKMLQKKWGGVIVLKGAGTLIYDGKKKPIQVCRYQNAAMATSGMGDVLSGIIGGLVSQGFSSFYAASQGVWLHAQAGKLAFEEITKKFPRRNLLAHELFPYLGC